MRLAAIAAFSIIPVVGASRPGPSRSTGLRMEYSRGWSVPTPWWQDSGLSLTRSCSSLIAGHESSGHPTSVERLRERAA
jgi:hypothetical protein